MSDVQVVARLSLQQLISDAKKAQNLLAQQLKDQEIKLKPVIDTQGTLALSKSLSSAFGEVQQFAKALGLTSTQASQAIDRINQLNAAGATTAERYQALKAEFGLTAIQMYQLGQAAKLTQQNLDANQKSIQNNSQAIAQLANALGLSYGEAQQFAKGLGLTAQQSGAAVSRLQALRSASATVDEQFSALNKELGISKGQFDQLTNKLNAFEGSIKGAGGGLSGFFTGIVQGVGQSAFFALTASIQQAVAALQSFVGESLNAAIEIDKINNKLNLATGSTEKAAEAYKFVRETAKQFGLDAKTAAQGFSDIAIAARGTAIEGENTRQLFIGLSAAFAANGLSADQQKGALLALQQIISKGKLSAEELRGQLGERLPGAFRTASRALGVTEVELNKLLETGQIFADDFIPRFAQQLQLEFGGTAVNAAVAGIAGLNTAVFDLQVSLGKAIQPAQIAILNGLSEALSKAIDPDNTEAFNILGDAAQRFADSIANNPQLVEDLATTLTKLAETLAQGVASGLDAVTNALRENPRLFRDLGESAGNSLTLIVQLLQGTIALVQALTPVVKVLFVYSNEQIKLASTLLGGLLTGIEKVSGAIDSILQKAQGLQGLAPFLNLLPGGSALSALISALPKQFDDAKESAKAFESALPKPDGSKPAVQPPAPLPKKTDPASPFDSQLDSLENSYKQALAVAATAAKDEDDLRKRSLDAETDYLNQRIAINQQKAAALKTALESTTDASQQKKLQEEILKAEQSVSDDRIKLAKNTLDAKANAEKASAEAAKKAQEEAVSNLERSSARATAAIENSQNQRIAAVRQAQLSGVIGEEEAQKQIEAIQSDGIAETIAAKQDEISQIAVLRKNGTLSAEEAADRELQLTQEVGKLKLEQIEQELAAQKAARDELIRGIEEESNARRSKLEVRSGQLDLRSNSLSAEKDLLSAQFELSSSLAALEQERLNTQIASAEAAGNTEQAERLREQQLRLQSEQVDRQFEAKKEQLKIDQQMRAIDLERQKISAQIAVLEAEAAIAKAEAEGASQRELNALKQVLGLRLQQVGAIDDAISSQDELNALQDKTLEAEYQTSREQQRQAQLQQRSQSQQSSSTGSQDSEFKYSDGGNTRTKRVGNVIYRQYSTNGFMNDRSGGSTANALLNGSGVAADSPLRKGGVTGQIDTPKPGSSIAVSNLGTIESELKAILVTLTRVGLRPNLAVTSTQPVSDAAKIYADLASKTANL